MKDNYNVLLLGLFDTAIMTARCFKGMDVKIFGMDYDIALSGFYSRLIKSIKIPDPKIDEKIWLKVLVRWLVDNGGNFILIPTSDEFVLLAAKYSDQIKKYCTALLPSYDTIITIIQRDKQFNSASDCGIYVPNFIKGEDYHQESIGRELRLPVAFKPVNITEWKREFTTKGFIVKNEKEFSHSLSQLKNKNVRYLIQNVIEGDTSLNYEVNSLYLPNGQIIQHSIRKIRQFPDEFGTATCIEACNNKQIEELATKYIKKNNIFGFSNIEFKYNPSDQKYYYIETNTRVWLQVNYSKQLGINFPLIYYKYLIGIGISVPIKLQRNGKWVNLLSDILFWKRYHKKYSLSILKFLKSWLPLISTGLFSFTDPLPFIKDLNLRKQVKRLITKISFDS